MNTKEKIRVLILFLTLSFFLNINAQTSLDSISFYYQKADYKKSISFAEELIGVNTINTNPSMLLNNETEDIFIIRVFLICKKTRRSGFFINSVNN